MSWESITWRPADASNPEGVGAILDLVPMLRSALDESASALIQGSATVSSLEIATVAVGDLPDGFGPLVSFQLLGSTRRAIKVAASPMTTGMLGSAAVDPSALGRAFAEALDSALTTIVGEGLNIGPVDGEPETEGDLILFRLGLADAEGNTTSVTFATDASVPVEFATHIVALQALGVDTGDAGATAESSVEETPVVEPSTDEPAPLVEAAPVALPIAEAIVVGAAISPADLPPLPANVRPLVLGDLPAGTFGGVAQSIEMLLGVNLQVTVEIGRTRLPIREVLSLAPGSIVELDKLAGEKVDVLVNGHQIASGEVVVVDDNFGVRITDVVSRHRRLLSADGAA